MRGLILTLCVLLCAGCGIITYTPAGAAGKAPAEEALTATVMESELRMNNGRLFATIVLSRPQQNVEG